MPKVNLTEALRHKSPSDNCVIMYLKDDVTVDIAIGGAAVNGAVYYVLLDDGHWIGVSRGKGIQGVAVGGKVVSAAYKFANSLWNVTGGQLVDLEDPVGQLNGAAQGIIGGMAEKVFD